MATKRRGRGEGGITQRKDGSWCASVSLGFNENGKRRRLWAYGDTKADVQRKLDDLRRKYGRPGAVPTNLSLRDYLKQWVESTQVGESTRARYRYAIEQQLAPHAYGMRLDRLTPGDVELIYSRIEPKTITLKDGSTKTLALDASRRKAHLVLQKALGDAVRKGLLTVNAAALVDAPTYEADEREPWNVEEVRAFLAAIKGDALEGLYLLGVTGGMREGEILALDWRQVDLQHRLVSVRRTMTDRRRKATIGKKAKTTGSVRPVRLPRFIATVLERLPNRSGLVFPSDAGTPIGRGNLLKRHFYPLLDRLGLRRITFHDLRHTHATMLLLMGVHPKVVAERLGHDINTLMRIYAHVMPSMQNDAADQLDSFYDQLDGEVIA